VGEEAKAKQLSCFPWDLQLAVRPSRETFNVLVVLLKDSSDEDNISLTDTSFICTFLCFLTRRLFAHFYVSMVMFQGKLILKIVLFLVR